MVNWVCDVPNFSEWISATAQRRALACATKATRLLMAAQRLGLIMNVPAYGTSDQSVTETSVSLFCWQFTTTPGCSINRLGAADLRAQ